MTTFDKREKSYEAKFAHDQENDFKIHARRNKLLGLWAAEQLGLDGDEAEAYAKQVITADFDKPGDEDVFEKVWEDFQTGKVEVSAHRLRNRMDELLEEARRQVTSE
ncbi:MAG: DUF1476 domain-containing protein [Alphaproteobacteria bacterium]|jgi:hypothetical protein|nr:DUF1476 domain-containing protein [Alphaproteobacteria bacterium]MDP6565644.1 DUF1476 domain-containing protein [Alphaproteobacteria bacterium]MDP6811678.1 DUF1476 domain-containing protein [Alphaproteobacteria bacterium]